jgi:hypothetical protein
MAAWGGAVLRRWLCTEVVRYHPSSFPDGRLETTRSNNRLV